MTMHSDEILISDKAVQKLIAHQFRQWRDRPVRRIKCSGTVNAIYRIGDDLAARFPLRLDGAVGVRLLLEREAAASTLLAAASPVPVPLPVAIGEPGLGYPLPWSVQTWLPGKTAIEDDPSASTDFARDLAGLIKALRKVDTAGRHFDGGNRRGGDLKAHGEWIEVCFEKSEDLLDVPLLRQLWRRFRQLPRQAPDVMTHGDLIPGNVLVDGGRLAGVLDGGNFGPADPALDLIAGWHLLDDVPRQVFRSELECDDLDWERSKAWAFEQCLGAIWYYVNSNPAMSRMGQQTLGRIVAAAA